MWWIAVAWAEVRTYPDGLRVELRADPRATTVEVGVAFGVGSADEAVGEEGLAHLAEHLWFGVELGGEVVEARQARLDCSANAWTAAQWTSFVLSCPPAALEEVLGVELARLEPSSLRFPAELVAREHRIVAAEEFERADGGAEHDFLLRQLLPVSHPIRARTQRPPVGGTAPTPEAVAAFVQAHWRPAIASLALSGRLDEAATWALLERRLGAGTVARSLPPVRPADPPRTTLRVAPRVVDGVALHPVVYVGWSQPRLPGLAGPAVDSFIELSLRGFLDEDPRVADLDCGHAEVWLTRAFYCRVEAMDDEGARGLGAELPGWLAEVQAGRIPGWISRVVDGQSRLWYLATAQRHGAAYGAWAAWRARDLLEGLGGGGDEDLRAFLKRSMLADTALVLVLPGTGKPAAPLSRPAVGEAAWPALPVPEVEAVPLATARRLLPNGLELVAVQRPDTLLLHAAVHARVDPDPASVLAALGGTRLVEDAWRADVLEIDHGEGPDASRTLLTVPGLAPIAAALFRAGLEHRPWSPTLAAQRVGAGELAAGISARSAREWARSGPLAALHPEKILPSAEVLRAVRADEVQRVLPAVYAPSRTRIAIVGPEAPELALEPFVAAFSDWAVPERASVDPEIPAAWPRALHAEIPGGVQAWVGLRCPLGQRGGAAAVAARVLGRRLVAALRVEQGLSYAPATWVEGEELGVLVSVEPARAASVQAQVLAAFSPPDEPELARARADARGWWGPARTHPELLAASLARGDRTVVDLAEWDSAVEASTAEAVGEALGRCGAAPAWTVAGPPGTAAPDAATRWVSAD